MKSLLLIIVYVCQYSSLSEFNFHQTDILRNGLDSDCLFVNPTKESFAHPLIEYCIRSKFDKYTTYNINQHPQFTFKELYEHNITSEELYKWSAPIDLIENYEIYRENTSVLIGFIFYNCTFPWFGSYCQYTFDEPNLSFAKQFEKSIQMKLNDSSIPDMLPCYTHIECDRTGDRGQTPGACLDWREICDGKVDCLDGGRDEESCWQLEINECNNETEFRCYNGQCIPLDFLNDDVRASDCLDQSDEKHRFSTVQTSNPTDLHCNLNPGFRCEEHRCYKKLDNTNVIECGDGTCVMAFYLPCSNHRTTMLTRAFLAGANVSKQCRDAVSCLIGIMNFASDLNAECNMSLYTYADVTKQYCPKFIEFPPFLFGHVHLIYKNDQSHKNLNLNTKENWLIPPDYICYDEDLCGKNILPTAQHHKIELDNYNRTCRSFEEFNIIYDEILTWSGFMEYLYHLFKKCSSYHQITSPTVRSNLYQCANSSKIISRHHLVDLIPDCLYEDDESYNDSCSLDLPNYRFKCGLGDKTICLPHIYMGDGQKDCANGPDEVKREGIDWKNMISFQTICDGYTELIPVLIDGRNQTDETECDYFPCNNTYTRCDGYWNCANGADEVNCEWPPVCPNFHHLCLSPITGNITCLPIERINDGKVDCFGESDERERCHRPCAISSCASYQCWNDNNCNWVLPGCRTPLTCPMIYNVSKVDCRYMNPVWLEFMCFYRETYNHVEQILCHLDSRGKSTIKHLSLTMATSFYPSLPPASNNTRSLSMFKNNLITQVNQSTKSSSIAKYCNRGVPIRCLINNSNDSQLCCLCSPAYHGHRCEYQTQRVSLTAQIRVLSDFRITFALIILLMDDQQGLIESYDQYNHLPMYDCVEKYSTYLLYKTRPKNTSTNYTVRIDIYEKASFEFRGSWSFPIQFSFLPVYRLAIQLHIPLKKPILQVDEREKCGNHGHSLQYTNKNSTFCYCDKGWYGLHCDISYECTCSSDSLCLGPNLCLCPVEKTGPRCYLKRPTCSCKNGGSCSWSHNLITGINEFWCICPDGFSGPRCEEHDTKIIISFASDGEIPASILLHFIQVQGRAISHIHTTVFKKIPLDENTVVIFKNDPFHIFFIEIEPKTYYFIQVQPIYYSVANTTAIVTPLRRCLSIAEVFNATIVSLHRLRRIKLYHIPCQEQMNLNCFYDETQMCICNHDIHQANCFNFNHDMKYNCKGRSICENEGRCFYDKPDCPSSLVCVCDECSYGSRCQFSTQGFALSLDIIFGYQIKPNKSFDQQRLSIKITTAIVTVMLVCGLISGICSIMTFQRKKTHEVGCGYYLLISSYASTIVFVLFALKFYLLIVSQMGTISNQAFLSLNCILLDFFIKSFVNMSDWLSACVGIERTVATYQENRFNKIKAKKIAKWVIIIVCIVTITTNLQDPFHRSLINDKEEHRTWCIVQYSPSIQIFNVVILLFHFVCPFALNLISAFIVIFKVTYHRSAVQNNMSYQEQLKQQFCALKHLIISPILLVTLALPRLVISFLSGCMKSPRDPWLFLFGYFISFLPPMLIFVVFILPSKYYKKEFRLTILRIQKYFVSR